MVGCSPPGLSGLYHDSPPNLRLVLRVRAVIGRRVPGDNSIFAGTEKAAERAVPAANHDTDVDYDQTWRPELESVRAIVTFSVSERSDRGCRLFCVNGH